MSKVIIDADRVELAAERIPTRSVKDPEKILITIPQLKLCERTQKVSYIPDGSAVIRFKNDAAEVRYDFCVWNDVDDRVEKQPAHSRVFKHE